MRVTSHVLVGFLHGYDQFCNRAVFKLLAQFLSFGAVHEKTYHHQKAGERVQLPFKALPSFPILAE